MYATQAKQIVEELRKINDRLDKLIEAINNNRSLQDEMVPPPRRPPSDARQARTLGL